MTDGLGSFIQYQRIQVVVSLFQKCSDLDISSCPVNRNDMAGDTSHIPELDSILQFGSMRGLTRIDWRSEEIISEAEMSDQRQKWCRLGGQVYFG